MPGGVKKLALTALTVSVLFVWMALAGCDGDDGKSTGTLSGTVTNNLTAEGLGGVVIVTDPPVNANIVTAADGFFSAELPIGTYEVTVSTTNFLPQEEMVSITAGQVATRDVALDPVAPVVVEVSMTGTEAPGQTLSATMTVTPLDGSTLQTTTWSQKNSVDVTFASPNSTATDVTLPDLSAFKDELIQVLKDPPVTAAELPPNVPLPPGEFPAGLQSRFQIVGVNPFALEEAGLVTLVGTATTTSGSYTGETTIHADLPWKPNAGVKSVPLGVPVVLHGRDHVDVDEDGINDDTGLPTTYDWSLTVPTGSSTTLMDGTSQDPWFTPDILGEYVATVTDTTQLPGNQVVTVTVKAGRWEGAITGQDANGRPLAANCTSCHDDVTAPDKFTPWAQTGHAEIFTDLLNTSTHYGENCFPCHTLGFDLDPAVDNDGVDDFMDYQDFLAAGLLNNPGDNWTTVLADFPAVAARANVQCEHCHGPLNTGAHPDPSGVLRTNLSSDVCAQCHGEPFRHARFQQWQLSGHANYEVAIDEGMSGNCSRCHTANGFLAWLPVLLGDQPGDPLANVTVTWTEDEVHPQTCSSCHDPHSIGTTSGSQTNATVRISGSTPPLIAGFSAAGVGKGAICMTCHNTRRGERNDGNFADTQAAGDTARAPHGSAQADVLMGQNAYFVEVGVRGNHSLVKDTCVNCHMEQTPPPAILSYNQGGTNHTFFASDTICSNCHGDAFDAAGVEEATDTLLADLKALVEQAILAEIDEETAAGNNVVLDVSGTLTVITSASTITAIDFGEFRGRQSITVTVDMNVVGPVRLNNVTVEDPAMMDPPSPVELYSRSDDRVPKAGWNYNLIYNDGSSGIHNPTFSQRILNASIVQLENLLGL